MANIFHYVEEYGDYTFFEKPFNDVDNLVFSVLPYLNFGGIVQQGQDTISLQEAGIIFLSQFRYSEVAKEGIPQRGTYKLLKKIINMKRYQDVLMSHYIYIGDMRQQFCAIKFQLPNRMIYISFEGSDRLLGAWREDFELCYKFPTKSQEYAIDYLNNNIHLFDKNVIVGGHSKGGNLALIASMYTHYIVKKKIIKVYSNDGPGLRKRQIESRNYRFIQPKFQHIIPNYSLVGLLLRHDDCYQVVKSNRRNLASHSIFTWQIEDDHFMNSSLSKISQKLDQSLNLWLDDHNDGERKKMITSIFRALSDSGIYRLDDVTHIKNAYHLIQNLKDIDQETKELFFDFLSFNVSYLFQKKTTV